ncbi:MAG: LamG domain-containing protein [Syntrophales bacterium]|nr:LamG domain-containing protein [Syntrophales bacterium]
MERFYGLEKVLGVVSDLEGLLRDTSLNTDIFARQKYMKMYRSLKRMGFGLMGAVMMVLVLGADWACAGDVVTGNLIKNPIPNTNMNYWITSNGFTRQHDVYWRFRGGGQGGGGVWSDAYQDVDVSQYVGAIDGKCVQMSFSGWVRGQRQDSWPNNTDDGWFEITFYDGSGNELGKYPTNWHNGDWTKFEIKDKPLPEGTRKIRVKMAAHRNYGENQVDAWFYDPCLVLRAPKVEVITPSGGFDFGNVYLATNDSAKAYNKSQKKTLIFKNTGDALTKQSWSISSSPYMWIKFSKSSGELGGGMTENVDVWVEPPEGYEHTDYRDYFGNFNLTLPFEEIGVSVSARAYDLILKPTYVSPAQGANSRVNVALNANVRFEVASGGNPVFPGATLAGYQWKLPGNSDFGNPITNPQKNTSFSDAGEYTLYCRTIDSKGVWSGSLTIPVRAWNRPEVKNTPPQSADVSWYNGKYVGVVGKPVYLMADANLNGNEAIEKYLWDMNDNWATQTAGQVVSHIWNSSNLNGNIRCKAVTNYGVESDPAKVFDLKIYDTLNVNPQGPYTGKPNKPVSLACSINKTAYPSCQSIEYQWYVGTTSTSVSTNSNGEAEYTWTAEGSYELKVVATVTTSEGLKLTNSKTTNATIEAGKPTAMPGGPYKGGIAGGNFSPIQFSGNPPDFKESDDVGHIKDWQWVFAGVDGGLMFDGQNDYVDIPGLTWQPTAFTVSWWLYPLSHTNWNQHIMAANGWNGFVFHTTKDGGIYTGIGWGTRFTPTNIPNGTLQLNQWQHLAFTFDNGTATF